MPRNRSTPVLLLALVALGALACSTLPAAPQATAAHAPLDLARPKDNLQAFVKMRGSLDPNEEVVFYWKGIIYSYVADEGLPLQKSQKALLRLEGFDVARFVRVEDGYHVLSRAVVLYEDPTSGRILDCWENPLNGKRVSVVHAWNDPINMALLESRWRPMPFAEHSGRVMSSFDMLLAYPSPLPVARYPEYSSGDVYQSAEVMQLFASRAELEGPSVSVPSEMAWVRLGPYLPWMQMGSQPGLLLYQSQGYKVHGGWEGLPAQVREYVARHRPEFQHPPTEWPAGQRNTTTWGSFKQLVDSGQYAPACQ